MKYEKVSYLQFKFLLNTNSLTKFSYKQNLSSLIFKQPVQSNIKFSLFFHDDYNFH